MQDDPRALELLEARVGPRRPVGRQAREVGGQVEMAVGVLERPEGRLAGRLRVGRDGGRRAGQGDQQRALAAVGQADDGDVHRQAQLQGEPGLLARRAGHGGARRLVGGRAERPVADAAVAAARHRHPVAGRRQLGDAVAVAHHARARGHGHQQVAARAAVARLALAVAARRGPVVHGVAEPREVGHLVVGHQHDAAAAPAVAAVRPPARDLRLAAERQAAVAAVAPLHVDLRPIGEGHGPAGS